MKSEYDKDSKVWTVTTSDETQRPGLSDCFSEATTLKLSGKFNKHECATLREHLEQNSTIKTLDISKMNVSAQNEISELTSFLEFLIKNTSVTLVKWGKWFKSACEHSVPIFGYYRNCSLDMCVNFYLDLAKQKQSQETEIKSYLRDFATSSNVSDKVVALSEAACWARRLINIDPSSNVAIDAFKAVNQAYANSVNLTRHAIDKCHTIKQRSCAYRELRSTHPESGVALIGALIRARNEAQSERDQSVISRVIKCGCKFFPAQTPPALRTLQQSSFVEAVNDLLRNEMCISEGNENSYLEAAPPRIALPVLAPQEARGNVRELELII